MRSSPTAAEFTEFCRRFVRNYWDEVAQGTAELPGSEPCEQSLEELLSAIEYSPSFEQDGVRDCALRMANTTGDVWRFTFRPKNGQWVIPSATSGTDDDEARVNWLDDVYSQWFRPLLDRITLKSL